MKKPNPDRYQKKPVDFEFDAPKIIDPPGVKEEVSAPEPPKAERKPEVAPVVEEVRPVTEQPKIILHVPSNRHKMRFSLDVYEDQIRALKKFKVVLEEDHKKATLTQMFQEALDDFIGKTVKNMPDFEVRHEEQK